ncbi:predicted protein [Postia placenta Mad-698-R]|uniref:Protein-S-isoprenylcysteine O-methyltransferase n=2 Tax=Rhodonia placenta TaxID=104341 RepID=A0A1X6N226_9APHY|nr:hypothetical protein POSPLADRAFT_1141882 [Postia placenta MAD-698-R-SB12]EED82425.1 predicted protein [Postia placenta Mad-698-R]KAF9812179.1 hypothetical protein IEO21_06321 [Postia placenta]OSX62644.1 hypothetical protein POSPLADRAFT_1141882 [Postia placenta MAD-698-R-SB12]
MSIFFTVKSLLLLAAVFGHHVGLMPPRPTREDELAYKGQLFERTVMALAHLVRGICPNSSPESHALFSLSTPFVAGVTTIVLTAALRLWCYATLGRLFTFLVTIRPEHKLITSGPYAYVRHPSYTGVVLMQIGVALIAFEPGGYMVQCRLLRTPIWWLVLMWAVCNTFTLLSLNNRAKVEDDLMRVTFKEEWKRYSQRVPYKFLPFIL